MPAGGWHLPWEGSTSLSSTRALTGYMSSWAKFVIIFRLPELTKLIHGCQRRECDTTPHYTGVLVHTSDLTDNKFADRFDCICTDRERWENCTAASVLDLVLWPSCNYECTYICIHNNIEAIYLYIRIVPTNILTDFDDKLNFKNSYNYFVSTVSCIAQRTSMFRLGIFLWLIFLFFSLQRSRAPSTSVGYSVESKGVY